MILLWLAVGRVLGGLDITGSQAHKSSRTPLAMICLPRLDSIDGVLAMLKRHGGCFQQGHSEANLTQHIDTVQPQFALQLPVFSTPLDSIPISSEFALYSTNRAHGQNHPSTKPTISLQQDHTHTCTTPRFRSINQRQSVVFAAWVFYSAGTSLIHFDSVRFLLRFCSERVRWPCCL